MYLEFYGLNERPFNMTPAHRFLFFSAQHREAYLHLLYGIEHRKGFIVLTGEVGSGKTTLCRAVLSDLKSRKVETALVLNPWLSSTQLLRAILHDFGIEASARDRLGYVERLNRFLLEKNGEGFNVALLIDEAQDLPVEVLEQIRLLSNLETDEHKLLQIVLCGQPELEERLLRPELRQLRQRISVRYDLQPLKVNDVATYVRYRLQVAGSNGKPTFSAAAIRKVHRYSRGIPRLINAVCDYGLMAGYVAETMEIDAACVERAIEQLEGTSR